MKPRNKLRLLPLMLLLPALLLTACAHESPDLSPPPEHPAIPPLPAQARVSLVATPSMCSSTCSAGLTALRGSLAITPTDSGSPGSLANGHTTP